MRPIIRGNVICSGRGIAIARLVLAVGATGAVRTVPCAGRAERDGVALAARAVPGTQLSLPVAGRPADLLGLRDGERDPRLVCAGRDRLGPAAHRPRLPP